MKTCKPLIVGLLSLIAATASASDTHLFTVAIIKDADNSIAFERNMGLCVAHLKANSLTKAKSSCSTAITSLDSKIAATSKGKYLKALAYSNRGIVKHFSNDDHGALEDFTSALLLSGDEVITNNVSMFKKRTASISANDSETLTAAE